MYDSGVKVRLELYYILYFNKLGLPEKPEIISSCNPFKVHHLFLGFRQHQLEGALKLFEFFHECKEEEKWLSDKWKLVKMGTLEDDLTHISAALQSHKVSKIYFLYHLCNFNRNPQKSCEWNGETIFLIVISDEAIRWQYREEENKIVTSIPNYLDFSKKCKKHILPSFFLLFLYNFIKNFGYHSKIYFLSLKLKEKRLERESKKPKKKEREERGK